MKKENNKRNFVAYREWKDRKRKRNGAPIDKNRQLWYRIRSLESKLTEPLSKAEWERLYFNRNILTEIK